MRMPLQIRVAAVLLFCVLAGSVKAQEVRLPVPAGGRLVLMTPQGWRAARQPDSTPTVSFTSASDASFQVLVSLLVAPDGRTVAASPESLRRLVESGANHAQSQAVEKSLPVQSFGSGNVQGYHFSATDRAPKAGEFKFMTQGIMSVSGLPVSFTILSNGDPQVAKAPALRMLGAARKE